MTESIRDLKIEYGSLSFGDTSTRRIDSSGGKITMERSAEEACLVRGRRPAAGDERIGPTRPRQTGPNPPAELAED